MTQYAYDDENNLTSITDANNHTTSFQYDQYGRVKETDFPSGHAESYIYDAIGDLITKTDRNGNAITYVYDALKRLTHKGYPDSTGVDYIYDLVGKIKSVTDPTGTYGFAYDNMGRLIGTSTAYSFLPGQTYTNNYAYDAASNRTGFTAPDGSTNTYGYDNLNRLTSLTNSLTGQFGFGYDTLSRRTSLTRPNSVTTSYSYDSLSRLLSVLHQNGATTIDGASYTLDSAGNRTSKQNWLNGITENYTYDPIYQLTQVDQIVNGNQSTTESYSYDAVGNRLSSLNVASYSYNSSNELSSSSDGYSYTYDFNGNTLTKSNSSGTTQYAWDFENRLASATLPSGGGIVSFKYDPFGRRIQKSSSSGITSYLYDGDGLLEELDGTGTAVARYAQGPSVDEPFTMVRGGATNNYNFDGLGSITSLASTTGSVTQTYTFDTFGKRTATNGSITNPFEYTGRELDSETGLLYLRARYYDPSNGRFLSEDAIRFSSGTVNFYPYVGNDPTDMGDPLGLARCWLSFGTLRDSGMLVCLPDRPGDNIVIIAVNSGNNGNGLPCRNNPRCSMLHDEGPIPKGDWHWTNDPTSKPNGRVLEPDPGTETYNRDLFRTHSCRNPWSNNQPFCSAGCVTGLPGDIKTLNRLLDAEPGSTLHVID